MATATVMVNSSTCQFHALPQFWSKHALRPPEDASSGDVPAHDVYATKTTMTTVTARERRRPIMEQERGERR